MICATGQLFIPTQIPVLWFISKDKAAKSADSKARGLRIAERNLIRDARAIGSMISRIK